MPSAASDNESVTLMTVVPVVPAAVNKPLVAFIDPPPLKTEYEYGPTPFKPAKVKLPLAKSVTAAGFIPKPVTTVTEVSEVLP